MSTRPRCRLAASTGQPGPVGEAGTGSRLSPRFRHIEFDLIFIDGNHAYEVCGGNTGPLCTGRCPVVAHLRRPPPAEAVKLDMLLCMEMATQEQLEDARARMKELDGQEE